MKQAHSVLREVEKWGIKKFLPIPVWGSGVIRFVWSLCVRPSVGLSFCWSVRLLVCPSVLKKTMNNF